MKLVALLLVPVAFALAGCAPDETPAQREHARQEYQQDKQRAKDYQACEDRGNCVPLNEAGPNNPN